MTMTDAYKDFTAREFQRVMEVANFGRIGRPQVDKAIQSGELPVRRFGQKTIRIRTVDALAWLGVPLPEQSAEQPPAAEQK